MLEILKRIDHYKNLKGWTEYKLAAQSGITQSTINSWYRNNTCPSVPSIEKICNGLGITMGQFFSYPNTIGTDLTPLQTELMDISITLSEPQLKTLISFIKTINQENNENL
jgi:transcriptional regulator with XRE-family HTH domain